MATKREKKGTPERKSRSSESSVSQNGKNRKSTPKAEIEAAAKLLETSRPPINSTTGELSFLSPRKEGRWSAVRQRLKEWRVRIHRRGISRLTIMVIPHSEKKILNLHVNAYTITGFVGVVLIVLSVSIISLVGKSGEDIEFYDMGLTNSQFNIQSTKMAEEMLPLHNFISRYAGTIAQLYIRLDGNEQELIGQGGVAQQELLGHEITTLKSMIEECRTKGDKCDQTTTEDILRRVIALSKQDNESLKQTVEISSRMIADLKTKEKQNLLQNTPSIWPVRGYLLSPYGWQVDPITGRRVFKQGIGIGVIPGTEVSATAPGTIAEINYDSAYGISVWMIHKYGMKTFYAHLDRVKVNVGDTLNKGQGIGFAGKTGSTPVYQLYYEVHVGTVAYNPYGFLNHIQDQWLNQPKL